MKRLFTLLKVFACLLSIVSLGLKNIQAQTPFDGPNYANHWINPSQTYVRVEVTKAGLYTVAKSLLASAFPTVSDITKFRIYRRGKEVQILSTANDKLLFYGEPNDGAMDSLLYRPTSARGNPYVSLYSDKGVYFITATSASATPVPVWNQALAGTPEPYHLHSDTVAVGRGNDDSKKEYSQSTQWFIPTPYQSYFENQETWTINPLKGGEEITYNFKLKNRPTELADLAINPKLELMVNGGNSTTSVGSISLGKNTSTLSEVGTYSFYGFKGVKINCEFSNSNLNDDGTGVLRVTSTASQTNARTYVTYYSFTYPQQFIVQGTSYQFNLKSASASGWSRVKIWNVTDQTSVYDITNKYVPQKLTVTKQSDQNFLEVMVPRVSGKMSNLYVSSTATEISSVTVAKMVYDTPSNYNYFIITNTALFNVANTKYKDYRSSVVGGGFKPLVVNINDIYNQFNYGEPSPLAIRRFIDFMISDGNKSKYVLLLGNSTTFPERMTRDMPNEVPAIGYPGSDILLVTGLGGVGMDMPAVAIGRLSIASDPEKVTDYLDKVKEYENPAVISSWKKNVLQMYGAKSTSEASLFKGYLEPLQSVAMGVPFSGGIIFIDQPVPNPPNISSSSAVSHVADYLNSGVGLFTYFGHGTLSSTWFNVDRISLTPAYSNSGKYPIMYFNGCGIGNVFANNPASLAFDWVAAKSKGAIAFITSSYFSYGTPSAKHLKLFYDGVFKAGDSSRKRIGDILNDVASGILASGGSSRIGGQAGLAAYDNYDVQNFHQVILQGDPALKVLMNSSEVSLPVALYNFRGEAENNTVLLTWSTASEQNSSVFDIQVSKDGKSFETVGTVIAKGTTSIRSDYSWKHENVQSGIYYYRLKQVDLDGKSALSTIVSVKVGNKSDILVGPNPVDKIVRIAGPSKKFDVRVVSTSGVEVFREITNGSIDLSRLSSGIYILNITGDDGLMVSKQIIKR